MSLELTIIIGFLLHLVGDYIFQNDWIANGKTKSHIIAYSHALIYSTPFLFLFTEDSIVWWLGILITHYLIDRYRLAIYWIKLMNWNWDSDNFGYGPEKPAWMAVWLMIIIDNTFHLLINTFCLIMGHYFPWNPTVFTLRIVSGG